MKKGLLALACLLFVSIGFSQATEEIVGAIQKEANENSQLELLAHELMDVIGPLLVGTPQMKNANDWAVEKWSISTALNMTENMNKKINQIQPI